MTNRDDLEALADANRAEAYADFLTAELDRLRSENARLREALKASLQQFGYMKQGFDQGMFPVPYTGCDSEIDSRITEIEAAAKEPAR